MSTGNNGGTAPSFGDWLHTRLAQERYELESRHIAFCDAVNRELSRSVEISRQADANALTTNLQATEAAHSVPVSASVDPATAVYGSPVDSGSWPEQSKDSLKPDSSLAQGAQNFCSVMLVESNKEKTGFIRTVSVDNASMPLLQRIVEHPAFEMVFGALIIANVMVMALEIEYNGIQLRKDVGYMMEVHEDMWADADISKIEIVFPILEICFGVAFTIEVLVKMVALRHHFFFYFFNIFDLVIVVVWCLDSTVGLALIANPMLLRLVRLLRLLRLLRLVRMIELFDTLLLMVSSIRASLSVLIWGTLVLVITMTGCALVLHNLVSETIADREADTDLRTGLFEYWGTFGRCMVSMFEVTLGNWVPPCRLLMNHMTEWYGLAFIVYKCVVGFAVVKVITGVFMHETFKCAAQDDELMIQRLARGKSNFKAKMGKLFEESDTSSDGLIELKEFKQVLSDERVYNWLQAMDITITSPDAFFRRIAGPDMLLSSDELIKNMARNRGFASQVDAITLLEDCAELKQSLSGLTALVARQGQHLEVLTPYVVDASLATELAEFDQACVRKSPPPGFRGI